MVAPVADTMEEKNSVLAMQKNFVQEVDRQWEMLHRQCRESPDAESVGQADMVEVVEGDSIHSPSIAPSSAPSSPVSACLLVGRMSHDWLMHTSEYPDPEAFGCREKVFQGDTTEARMDEASTASPDDNCSSGTSATQPAATPEVGPDMGPKEISPQVSQDMSPDMPSKDAAKLIGSPQQPVERSLQHSLRSGGTSNAIRMAVHRASATSLGMQSNPAPPPAVASNIVQAQPSLACFGNQEWRFAAPQTGCQVSSQSTLATSNDALAVPSSLSPAAAASSVAAGGQATQVGQVIKCLPTSSSVPKMMLHRVNAHHGSLLVRASSPNGSSPLRSNSRVIPFAATPPCSVTPTCSSRWPQAAATTIGGIASPNSSSRFSFQPSRMQASSTHSSCRLNALDCQRVNS
jgi:hypothetical protein